MLDQFCGIASSALIASGRQSIGSLINFIGYFCIGFPIIYYNVFHRKTDLVGIWEGAATAVLFNGVCYLTAAFTTNWEQRID
jgi:multidrug resistance protein, MATE family